MSFHNFVSRTTKSFPHPTPPAEVSPSRSGAEATPRSSLDGAAGRSHLESGRFLASLDSSGKDATRSPRNAGSGTLRSGRGAGHELAPLQEEETAAPAGSGPNRGSTTALNHAALVSARGSHQHSGGAAPQNHHSQHTFASHHSHAHQLKPLDAGPSGVESGPRTTVHRLNPFESVRTKTLPGTDVSYNHDSPGHGKAPGRGFQRFTNVKLPPSLIPLPQHAAKFHPDPLAEGKWDDAGVESMLNLDSKGWHTQVFQNLKPSSRSDVTALAMWLKETLQKEKE